MGTMGRDWALEPRRPSVIGLVPRAVRLELISPQIQLLVDELVEGIEAAEGVLRGDPDRDGLLPRSAISDAGDWLVEYRTLLDAIGVAHARCSTAPTLLTVSTVAADYLVRACAARSVDLLRGLFQARSGDIGQLRVAGDAVAAWSTTLADLRELDENGPDSILE